MRSIISEQVSAAPPRPAYRTTPTYVVCRTVGTHNVSRETLPARGTSEMRLAKERADPGLPMPR